MKKRKQQLTKLRQDLNSSAPSELRKHKNLPFDFEEIVNKEDLSKISPLRKKKFIV